jgi:hypothetical protein
MKILNAARIALISLLITLPASATFAGELSAVFNGKSIHVNASEDWNDDNYGLGLEYQFATQSRWKKVVMANGFRDSNDEMSYMAGAGLHRTLFATDRLNGFYLDAGINAFLMTRKDVNDNNPFPGALPSLTIGNRYAGLNLTYLPKKAVEKLYDTRMQDESISGIVFLQFKVSFGQLMADN